MADIDRGRRLSSPAGAPAPVIGSAEPVTHLVGSPFVDSRSATASSAMDPAATAAHLQAHLDGIPYRWEPRIAMEPVLLHPAAYAELASAAVRITRLLEREYRSLGPSPQARAAALGISLDRYRRANPYFLADEVEDAWSASIARPDVVATADGFRIVECNMSAAVGGMTQTDLLRAGWASLCPDWAKAHGDAGAPALRGLAELVLRVADALALPPRVAVLGVPELYRESMRRHYLVEAAHLGSHGVDADAVTVQRLAEVLDASPTPPWPMALRRNGPVRWAAGPLGTEPLRRLVASGCVALAPQTSYLLADKRLLARISTAPTSLTDDDVEFVGRYVPWTRVVTPGVVEYEGQRRSLADLLFAAPDRFILKRGSGRAGTEVLAGRQATAEQWRTGVAAAFAAGDWVVQEYQHLVTSGLSMYHPVDGVGRREVANVFGPFVVSDRVYGCMTRTLDVTVGAAVISVSTGATLNVALPAATDAATGEGTR